MGKRAWETTIERLETQLEKAGLNATTHIHDIQQQLETARLSQALEMRVLMSPSYGYPKLVDLLRSLWWVMEAADVRRSTAIDPDSVSVPRIAGSVDEGASTRRYRRLQNRANLWVGELAEKIATELDGTRVRQENPRCRRRSCRLNGRRQPVDAKFCRECGGELSFPEAV